MRSCRLILKFGRRVVVLGCDSSVSRPNLVERGCERFLGEVVDKMPLSRVGSPPFEVSRPYL